MEGRGLSTNMQDLNVWVVGHEGEGAGDDSFQVSGLCNWMNADAIHRKRPSLCVCLGVGKRFGWKLSSTFAMLTPR